MAEIHHKKREKNLDTCSALLVGRTIQASTLVGSGLRVEVEIDTANTLNYSMHKDDQQSCTATEHM